MEEALLDALVDVIDRDAQDDRADDGDESLAERPVHDLRCHIGGLGLARGPGAANEGQTTPREREVEDGLGGRLEAGALVAADDGLGDLPQREQDEPANAHDEAEFAHVGVRERGERPRLVCCLDSAGRCGIGFCRRFAGERQPASEL